MITRQLKTMLKNLENRFAILLEVSLRETSWPGAALQTPGLAEQTGYKTA